MTLSRDESKVREGSTPSLIFQLYTEDRDGKLTKMLLADLSTLVLDYWDNTSTGTINSRADQNVKNANNVTVSATGEVKWTLQVADTTIQGSTLSDGDLELHYAVFKWTTTGSLTDNIRQAIYVIQESKV